MEKSIYKMVKLLSLGGKKQYFLKHKNPYLKADINKKTNEVVSGIPINKLNNKLAIESRLEDLYSDKKLGGLDDDINEAIIFLENIKK
jgi:hypothetical protein